MSADAIPEALPVDAPSRSRDRRSTTAATRVVGYALQLRGADGRDLAVLDDEEHVAARVIVETFTAIGVAALAGEHPAHVRVPRRFLLEMHALALPPERVVLEVADPGRTDAPMHAVLERLVAQRYRVSLACDPARPGPARAGAPGGERQARREHASPTESCTTAPRASVTRAAG